MKYILKNCLNCQKEFKASVRESNRGNAKFCNIKCSGEFNGKNRPELKSNVKCAWCQKDFYKKASSKKLSKSGLYFCTRSCKDEAQSLNGLKALHLPHFGTGKSSYRDIIFRTKEKKCERCNYHENELAIIVHHIDRDRANNKESNLEVLCANCHLIEHLE